jgi:hypothetical protein
MWLRRFGFIVLIVAMFTGILGLIMRPVQQVVVHWLTS